MILVQIQTLLIMLALSFLCIFTCTFSKSEDFNPSQNLLCFILKVLSCCCHLTFHHLYLICSWAILFICSPHTAGVIIWRRMPGLLCITIFWRWFSSFLQVLFRTIVIYYSRLYFHSDFYYTENIVDTC